MATKPREHASTATAEPEYITPSEAAGIIGCHKETVLAYVQREQLPALRPLGFGRGRPVLILKSDAVELRKRLRVVTGPGRKIASATSTASK